MHKAKVDADSMIPAGRENFRLDEIARCLRCSLEHLWKLVKEGELEVPQENINKAPGKGSILVPRKSLVDFLRRRSSASYREKRRERKAEK
jgi:hypothetical protein